MKDSNLPPLSESMQEQLLKELELNFPMDGNYSVQEFDNLSNSMVKFVNEWRTTHGV